jgi:hypothetical protein
MRGTDARDQTDGPEAFDPLSDIFFSAIAVVFVALIAIAPMIAQGRQADDTRSPHQVDDPPQRDHVLFQERELPLLLATATGISLAEAGGTIEVIPLDQIQDAARLKMALAGIVKTPDARLLMMIDPDGSEAAFLLEPMLAAARIRSIVQVRLTRACGEAVRMGQLQSCFADTLEPLSP